MTIAPTPITTAVSGFLIDEDEALKQKLSGFSVTNYSNRKQFPVAVYFRFPDVEERERAFPHIALDLIGVEFDAQRAQRALGFLVVDDPDEMDEATPQATPQVVYVTDNDAPLPWTLLYQLATYTRAPVQDRQLQGLMYQLFPEQFGFLDMGNIDGSVRRADLLSVVRRDTVDSASKRLYRNIFTIGVSSEFYVYQVQTVAQNYQIDVNFGGINFVVGENFTIPYIPGSGNLPLLLSGGMADSVSSGTVSGGSATSGEGILISGGNA